MCQHKTDRPAGTRWARQASLDERDDVTMKLTPRLAIRGVAVAGLIAAGLSFTPLRGHAAQAGFFTPAEYGCGQRNYFNTDNTVNVNLIYDSCTNQIKADVWLTNPSSSSDLLPAADLLQNGSTIAETTSSYGDHYDTTGWHSVQCGATYQDKGWARTQEIMGNPPYFDNHFVYAPSSPVGPFC